MNYFVPREACFGSKTGPAQAFGCPGGLSRDRVIEYLLSICTGVIFDDKTVSSHAQNIRTKLGGKNDNDPRKQTPEYLSVATNHGFAGDFPAHANPMVEQLDWMERYYRSSTNTNAEQDMRCPLILPPVLAAILEPAASTAEIDLNRMRSCFDFSQWSLPEGLKEHWRKDYDNKQVKKVERAAALQAKRANAASEIAPVNVASHDLSSFVGSPCPPPSYTRDITFHQAIVKREQDLDNDDRFRRGIQLDVDSVRCHRRYYRSETLAGRSFGAALARRVDIHPVPLRTQYIDIYPDAWPTSNCRESSYSTSTERLYDELMTESEAALASVTYPDSD